MFTKDEVICAAMPSASSIFCFSFCETDALESAEDAGKEIESATELADDRTPSDGAAVSAAELRAEVAASARLDVKDSAVP